MDEEEAGMPFNQTTIGAISSMIEKPQRVNIVKFLQPIK
jgi:hypothetical protein